MSDSLKCQLYKLSEEMRNAIICDWRINCGSAMSINYEGQAGCLGHSGIELALINAIRF